MPKKKQGPNKRTGIIILATIVSLILYLAGVFSGLYASKTIEQRTKSDLEDLQAYITFLDENLQNMQLEQTFMESLSGEEQCTFSSVSFEEYLSRLGYYWSRLPFRIEEYEKYNTPSKEYLNLKQEYEQLSIRTWILARNQYNNCQVDIANVLYFYSADCQQCVRQGEELDLLTKEIRSRGGESIVFVIDIESNQTITTNLKTFYNITSTPAIILKDKAYQGRLFSAQELLRELK